jgi:hypothetical protein
MPVTEPVQSYASHRRFAPLHHFVAFPLILLYLGFAVVELVRRPGISEAFHLAFALGVMALFFSTRVMTLTVQNRVIRLEMQLRLARVLPDELRGRIGELSVGQLVALRFASDAELPDLVARTLAGSFGSRDAIKREIRDWQPDRVRA